LLNAGRKGHAKKLNSFADEVDAENARLREALRPFAERAKEMEEREVGFRFYDDSYPADICKINAGELRTARAALEKR
jgi:hypothetical protein